MKLHLSPRFLPLLGALLVFLGVGCGDQTVGSYNTAPGAVIDQPQADEHVEWQGSTSFSGNVSDTEDALDSLGVEWTSSVDGVLSTDPAGSDGVTGFSTAILSPGQHTITLKVTDSGGLVARDDLQLYVDAPNQTPTAYITSPGNGEVFLDGEAVLLSGQVQDAEDTYSQLTFEWVSDLDGQLQLGTPDSSGHASYSAGMLAVGTHTLTLRAIDSDGGVGESWVIVEVRSENQPPALQILSPDQDGSYRSGENLLFELLADDPDGTNTDLELEIYDGAILLAAGLHPDSSGYLAWSTDDLPEGDHTVSVYAADPEGAYTTRAVQFEIRPPNTCPSTPVVYIDPPEPTGGDNLDAVLAVESTDPDEDAIDYEYSWYRDGVYEGGYALLVPATDTDRFETWRVEVTASDGDCTSAAATDDVTIGNSAPTVTTATLSPGVITETTGVNCVPSGWVDADGDSPYYHYQWTVNGVTVGPDSSALNAAYYARGNVVSCTVTPDDGFATGPSVSSASLTVSNTAPGTPAVALSPTSPMDDDDLHWEVTTAATDVDGDVLSYHCTWSRNGTEQASLVNQTLVPASMTSSGDTWTVSVRAWDGLDEGPVVTATASISAAPGLLVITEILYDPSGVSDSVGEWFEVHNPGAVSVDLLGWKILDDGGESHTIAYTVLVPAHGYAILGRNGDPVINGGVDVDYVYSGFSMDNSTDEVVLRQGVTTVDRVAWGGADFPDVTGSSLSVDPDSATESGNDDGTAWCPGDEPLDSGDLATPGRENSSCACYYLDLDEDGYTACDPEGADCDDTEADVFPGADELCDSLDNDCDGTVDDGLDVDGDGYTACGAGGDCNDGDATVYPGATEVCDSLDNNCDGNLNEGAGDAYETGEFYYYGTISIGTTASFTMTMHEGSDTDRLRFYTTDDGASDWLINIQVNGIPSGQDYDLEVREMADSTSETALSTVGASFNFGNASESVSVSQNNFDNQSGYYEARVTNHNGTPSCSAYTLQVTIN